MLKTVGNPSTRFGDQTIVDGNLIIGTAGKGIDFSADSHSAGMTSELLDDYEEGTWSPTISFQTVGDLSVTYAAQIGRYTKIGNRVVLQCFLVTSAFTHTTASGYLRINGIPFNGNTSSGCQNYGSLVFRGITKAGYTDFVSSIENGLPSSALVYGSASGTFPDFVSAANMPTGGDVQIKFTMSYETA